MTDGDRGTAVAFGIVAGLLLIHFTFHRFAVGWPGAPNLLVGALLLASLRLRAGSAAMLGFLLGILEAGMAIDGMGTISLVLAIVAYLAARSRDLLFADARYFTVVYLFVGTWTAEVGLMLAMPGDPGWLAGLVEAPVSALGTAVVCALAESVPRLGHRP